MMSVACGASSARGDELDREAVGRRAGAAAVEQRRDEVGGGDVGVAARGGERRVAVAGGDVEHALAGAQVEGLAERLAGDLETDADVAEVAGRPHGLLARLEAGLGRIGFVSEPETSP